jgi:hypothetical protein
VARDETIVAEVVEPTTQSHGGCCQVDPGRAERAHVGWDAPDGLAI